MRTEIRKKLSSNDVGTTGGHQAGILVPKEEGILSFFPELEKSTKNPRMTLIMVERTGRERWKFNFIYYNNRFFGGTRNEYRLTCMTQYIRSIDAKAGDSLVFSRDENASYEIYCARANRITSTFDDSDTLVLSGGWTVVKIR